MSVCLCLSVCTRPSGAAAGATAAMVSSSAAQPTLSDSAWLEIKGGSLSVCPMQEYAIALPSRDGALQSCFTCCKAGQHARYSRKISRPHGRHREAWPSAGAVERAQSSCHLCERDHSLIRWPPPVTQAPTTRGVEPDFFFWRAARARRRSRADRLREGKRPGQRSPSWPRASRLTVMLKPAAEVAGQPARGRGIGSERRVARTWPASGGARAEPLPSEALGAPWRPMASLGPTAFFQ